MTPRERILTGRSAPVLLRLSAPNIAASLIQSLLLVMEGWYAGRLGSTALAGVALTFPLFMLTAMLSAGAIGGAVSGAMARAVGSNDFGRANGVLRISVLIAVVLGAAKGALIVYFAPEIFRRLGGDDAAVEAASSYAYALFPFIVLLWLFNLLSSSLRGSGDMTRPAIAMAMVVALHASGLMALAALGAPSGLAGAAWAVVGAYAVGLSYLLRIVAAPGRATRLTLSGWGALAGAGRIIAAGAFASTQSCLTVGYSLVATAVFASFGQDWLAGYGVGARLELLVVPLIFGVGGASTVASGTLLGAGRREDAIRSAWTGGAMAATLVGALGLVLSFAPGLWTGLFSGSPAIDAAATAYLEAVGPFYAFFGLGLCLYFASQGLETLVFPVIGSWLRFIIICVGFAALGWADALTPQSGLTLIAGVMLFYGLFVAAALRLGPWRPGGGRTGAGGQAVGGA
ncbi:MAG: MATE family efflux transporter [Pseudomonadota bacterium]